MIELQDIHKVFLTHEGRELRAVDGLSLRVGRGEIYGLLGPNGAGKTTTLRMLAGLIAPTSGRLAVDGHVAFDMSRHVEDPLSLKHRIGFLTAKTGLYGRLTPRELLRYFGELRGIPRADLEAQIEKLIAALGIGEFADRRCEGFSTGQQQRVQIARTLVGEPPVLVLDEPTNGLDVLTNQLILKFITEAGRGGRTVVISTHHLDEVEEVCQRFGLIHKGRLLAEGTLDELRATTGRERLSGCFRELVARVDPEAIPQVALPGVAGGGGAA
ncbi:MAG: ABC transporter ATP-binding protein [Planctomycetota bacterium]|nr:ABC transporter ATP-binding protein [Planctomycetota bacterium]